MYLTGQTRSGLWPIGEVVGAAAAGEPSAWTTIGIWVLLAGPILALISMLISGVRRRSWPAVALSAVVLTVIILAIPTISWIQGSP